MYSNVTPFGAWLNVKSAKHKEQYLQITATKSVGTVTIALLQMLLLLPPSSSFSYPSLPNYTYHYHHHPHHRHGHNRTFYTISTLHFRVTGLRISARAIAKRCFWPPLSCVPASPTWLQEESTTRKTPSKTRPRQPILRVKGEVHNRNIYIDVWSSLN